MEASRPLLQHGDQKLTNDIRILTNAPGRIASPTWRALADFIPSEERSIWGAAGAAWRLYERAGSYDCVVLGTNKTGFFYGLYRWLLPMSRPYTMKLDCLWYLPSGGVRRQLKRLQWRLAGRGIEAFIVWASREVDAYSEVFGIPREKFHFIPYHHTLNELKLECRNEGYIFSGGNYGRDYSTLLQAVDGLPVRVEIASTRPELFQGLSLPSNVRVQGYSHEDYLQKMAGCMINAVCLDGGLLHSGGQQTFLNSMALGKPTIVTDPEGAADYIRHEKDGLLVPSGDAGALRAAIVRLLEDPLYSKRLAESGQRVARVLTTEAHFRSLVQFAAFQISQELQWFEVLEPGKARVQVNEAARSAEVLER